MQSHFVLPVIHYLDAITTLDQADVAFSAGADGVFLISHGGQDDDLLMPAMSIKGKYPGKMVGLNLLGKGPLAALEVAIDIGMDMIWVDAPEVDSCGVGHVGRAVVQALAECSKPIQFFGSVAFKYQPYEKDAPGAAVHAAKAGMLPTTSGSATGQAPDLEKIRGIHEALERENIGRHLALASGITENNVEYFMPYASHFLVASGVSIDAHNFDSELLSSFVKVVRSSALFSA